MDLRLGGGRVPSTGTGGPVLHVAVPVSLGRISLGRLGRSLAPSRPAEVRLVAGLRSACWVGPPPDARPPELGRLCHHTTATIDVRLRLSLDRHVRGPLLDESALCLVERLGMRPIEVSRLRLCDVDLVGAEVRLLGKGDRRRRLPLPPGLTALLTRYVEDRCPRDTALVEFTALETPFLRRRPTPAEPHGSAVGHVWLERLFPGYSPVRRSSAARTCSCTRTDTPSPAGSTPTTAAA